LRPLVHAIIKGFLKRPALTPKNLDFEKWKKVLYNRQDFRNGECLQVRDYVNKDKGA
jgi:hypothetical protein